VLAGNGRSVFTGRVVVHEGASGSNAGQRNDALLLSDGAHASSRPQLEIYNDDVSCTHGATTGQLDERSLFYLRQRGLSVDEASSLLARAFATEALQGVLKGELLDELEKLVAGRLATGSTGVKSNEVQS
jgi:Fe-S cluster assembly protein SufD